MDRTHKTNSAGRPDVARRSLRVLVTGGTSGLGLALVRALAARGDRVAFVARHEARVRTIARETNAVGIVGDVAQKTDVHRIALQALGALGGLDVLVNNASTLGPERLELLADTDCEDLALALETNLIGPFRLTKALLGALRSAAAERTGGVVVNVSSDAATTAYPRWGAYGASKAALHHMTRIWDAELEPMGLRFLPFDPGDMDTPLHAQAVPDGDTSTLRLPADAAAALLAAIDAALSRSTAFASSSVAHTNMASAAS